MKALTEKSEMRAEEISGLLEDLRETIFDYQVRSWLTRGLIGVDANNR